MDSVLTLVLEHVQGAARRSVEAAEAEKRTGKTDNEWWLANEPLLEKVFDPNLYPTARGSGRPPRTPTGPPTTPSTPSSSACSACSTASRRSSGRVDVRSSHLFGQQSQRLSLATTWWASCPRYSFPAHAYGRLPACHGVVPFLEFLAGDALHVRGDVPDVSEGVRHPAAAVAVFAVLDRHQLRRPCRDGPLEYLRPRPRRRGTHVPASRRTIAGRTIPKSGASSVSMIGESPITTSA